MRTEGRGGRARAGIQILLNYADHQPPPDGGPVEIGSLSALNLSLTLNTALGRSPTGQLTFSCCLRVYIALVAATPLVEGSISVHRKSPYKI